VTEASATREPWRIGRFEILGKLADGGMAEVLLGRLVGPRGFEHPVVIKRMLPELAREPRFVDMFVDEASIAAAVKHPNVVAVHELSQGEGELFLVLEYLEGESVGGLLRRLWSRGVELDRRLAAYIVAEACAGLHAAHELTDEAGKTRDLVHRDVSPQNILVTYAGAVKLLDFGIAKAARRQTQTEAGQLKGKFGYMSPEQCYGRPLDRRSDIFSLGIVLYELTTSRRLFKRDSDLETLKAITEQPVPPPAQHAADYPPALEAICLRALSRKRDDRFATAAEMRRALLAFVHGGGEGLPEEALAAVMERSFADRIEAKRELVRRAVAGDGVEAIPSAEVDETVEIPVVFDDERTQGTRSTMATASGAMRPRKSALTWLVPAALLAASGAALALVRWNAGIAPGATTESNVSAPAPASVPVPASAPVPASVPLPASASASVPASASAPLSAPPRPRPRPVTKPVARPPAVEDPGYQKL
jgi:serine/threonine-protein kinase